MQPARESRNTGAEWRTLTPLLAGGLLTPDEGRDFVRMMMVELAADTIDAAHKAFRSMTVSLLVGDTPSHRLDEWASVLKSIASATNKSFPVYSDRFISLRCMLLEASELRDMKASGHAERPGVKEVVRLLHVERRPMSLHEISTTLGADMHSIASRVRIGIASGDLKPDHEQWKTMQVSSASDV